MGGWVAWALRGGFLLAELANSVLGTMSPCISKEPPSAIPVAWAGAPWKRLLMSIPFLCGHVESTWHPSGCCSHPLYVVSCVSVLYCTFLYCTVL